MSASLLDTLQSHIFPPRGLHRTPTAPRPATSTQTTVVDIALVAACIRASSPDSIDSNPNPSVVFSCLNTQDEDEDERIHRVEGGRGDVHDILTTLSSTPSDLVLPLSIPTPEFVSQLQASTPIIQYDSATDKFQHYALLITVYRLLILLLFLSPSNFVGDQKPPLASWELALPPVGPGGSGKSDLEGIRMDGLGVPRRSGILWEYKRGLVLPLALLMIMVASGMRPGGFRLGLDREGEPVLDDDTLGDHVLKWCSQVLLEMDANKAHTVVISSWDHFIVLHRVSPTRISMTRIIARDLSDDNLQKPQGTGYYGTVRSDWSPLKLMFALLLAGAYPERLGGFVQPDTWHLVVPSVGKSSSKQQDPSNETGLVPSIDGAVGTNPDLSGPSKRRRSSRKEIQHCPLPLALTPLRGPVASTRLIFGRETDDSDFDNVAENLNDWPISLRSSRKLYEKTLASTNLRFDMVTGTSCCLTRHNLLARDWSSIHWSAMTFNPNLVSLPREPLSPNPSYPYPTPPNSTTSDCFTISSNLPSSDPPNDTILLDISLDHLQLGTYLSSGRLADAFSALIHVHPSPSPSIPVVIKLIDLESFPEQNPPPDSYNLTDATRALNNELNLYLTHLAPLQGKVVPRLYAIYVGRSEGRGNVVMLVLEDVGEAVSESWSGIPDLLRPRILAAYKALHEAGVMHRDLEPRHIRLGLGLGPIEIDIERGVERSLRLIDFEGASFVGRSRAGQEGITLGVMMGLSTTTE